ncbi:MAG: helix-turn-helix domain-containing protein [Acidiferrobacter sp.]
MARISDLKKKWMTDPEFRVEYEGFAEEFAFAREMIEARARAGLSQAEVAQRMGTTQSVIARLEGGRAKPSFRTIQRYAKATNTHAIIRLESNASRP